MTTYEIHYYKNENLTPDEKNAMRRNQSGIWLVGDLITAGNAHRACAEYRRRNGTGSQFRLRAQPKFGWSA